MNKKIKILLGITIGIILSCYGTAAYFIIEDSTKSEIPSVQTVYKKEQSDIQLTENKHQISDYKDNQLNNGSSPFDNCFGKGIYGGNATLTIKNGASSDAIVCLFSVAANRTIRNEYIQKNSSFTMDNIQKVYYKIRVFYGNDWNPEVNSPCGSKGYFESDIHFSEFEDTEFFEDDESGYTVATVTLYTVSGGNAQTTSISQSDFFRN